MYFSLMSAALKSPKAYCGLRVMKSVAGLCVVDMVIAFIKPLSSMATKYRLSLIGRYPCVCFSLFRLARFASDRDGAVSVSRAVT